MKLKRVSLINILIAGMLAMAAGCRKPYEPSIVAIDTHYLVVEGVINPGPDSTVIKLSRTVKLSENVKTAPELNATVTVESDQNNSYPLFDSGSGNYIAIGLNLPASQKYRLRIKTTDNREYLSDFVEVKNSPPIDSVSYVVGNNQLSINANTHDPTDNTRYYRWTYNETYEYHSSFFSGWKSNGDTVLIRDQVHDQIYTCWRGDNSSTIVLGSSARLAKDVISQNPITVIPATSEKIYVEYSMLLTQYALTSDAYNFWTNLKKNTEQLGSIFDAQPSQLKGNIHCTTNPTEPVIGYISAGTTTTKRILVSKYDLPLVWQILPDASCMETPYLFHYVDQQGRVINQEDQVFNVNKGALPGLAIPTNAIVAGTTVVGHMGADPRCVDCTLRGTNIRPSYWPLLQ